MASDSVKLIECPRDAWQGLNRQIPTELKARYLRALIAAGFKHIDAVSFVSPKAVPQMADSEKVLEQLNVPMDVEIIGIVVNEKGAERAINSGRVSTLGFPYSVSPTFLQKNQNQTIKDALKMVQSIKTAADECRLDMVVYVSMAFGNPYGDQCSEQDLLRSLRTLAGNGIQAISLADTVGLASSDLVRRVVESVMSANIGSEIGVHLHSASDAAKAKVLAAFDAGCRRFDSAIGGLGGCPFAHDNLVGNIPTESVLVALEKRGVEARLSKSLHDVLAVNAQIAANYS